MFCNGAWLSYMCLFYLLFKDVLLGSEENENMCLFIYNPCSNSCLLSFRFGVYITKRGNYRSTNGVAYTSPKCNRRGTFDFENCDVTFEPCDTEKDALYLNCGGKLFCHYLMCLFFIRILFRLVHVQIKSLAWKHSSPFLFLHQFYYLYLERRKRKYVLNTFL